MTAKSDLQIAIIGGGITGLTLAVALHHGGVSVKIYEQASHFGEIGAGVAFTPNAVQAMKLCHNGIYEAFEKVRTGNLWPSKHKVWFDHYDGYHDPGNESGLPDIAFTTSDTMGLAAVHRAHFLDEMVKLVAPGISLFGKRLEMLSEIDNDLLEMRFADGSTATAHAVLACDGIKSRVRQLLLGAENPCSYPTYTHKYAYRALAPMKDAIAVLGEERAQNSCMHMGRGGHILTFPIANGQIMNVVAFQTTERDWPVTHKLTTPATRENALADFASFAPYIKKLLGLAKPELDVCAIFDLGKHPLPFFAKGRTCLVGDAAHASSPHHGAGAGMGIEDSAVLSALLLDKRAVSTKDLETALAMSVVAASIKPGAANRVQNS